MMHDEHQERHRALAHEGGSPDLDIEVEQSVLPQAGRHEVRFRITDASGTDIEDFDEIHERRMHLIVVRRDLAHFMHVHPILQDDGWWSSVIDFPEPGPYTAFADFSTAGAASTLPVDLRVEGHYEPCPVGGPTETFHVDGYDVKLIRSGGEAVFTISTSDERVTLGPYLGARGHLVVIRVDDLAFLHVHPLRSDEDGVVRFHLDLPPGGSHKAFLQFMADGRVHTATFVVQP